MTLKVAASLSNEAILFCFSFPFLFLYQVHPEIQSILSYYSLSYFNDQRQAQYNRIIIIILIIITSVCEREATVGLDFFRIFVSQQSQPGAGHPIKTRDLEKQGNRLLLDDDDDDDDNNNVQEYKYNS